jgi:tetratricopeptide (TPR) repeat protein
MLSLFSRLFGDKMRARKLVIGSGLLFAIAAIVTSVPALAQHASSGKVEPFPVACASVAPGESERAHKLYEAGKSYYDDGSYDSAITQFREAYRKDCTKHELLVIISRAYELKGDRAAAISALEEYLQRVPGSPDAPQHRNRIENLRKQLAAQPAPAPASSPAPSASTATPPPATETRGHTIPPWILIGLGGAGIVAGVVVLATTPKLPAGCDASTQKCTRSPSETDAAFKDRQAQAGSSQNQPVAGYIALAAGGVFVAGGLLWHFLEPTGPVEKTGKTKPNVKPELGPGFAGLSLGGSF